MFPFSQVLYLWRIERGLTQQEFARRAGIPRPNLSVIERGKREVTLGTLRALAVALDIRPGVLADGIPPGRTVVRFSRHALERVADAVTRGKPVRTKEERTLAHLFRQVVTPRLNASSGKQLAFTGNKRKNDAAWLLLKSRYSPEILKSLLKRVSDR